MKGLAPLLLLVAATPAMAHHEAILLTALPGMMIWLAATIPVAGLAAWARRRKRQRKD